MSAVIALKKHFAQRRTLKAGKASAVKIDRFAELKQALDEIKPLQTEFEALKKEIVAEFTPHGDESAELTIKGSRYVLVLGPRSLDRSIPDVPRLLQKVGLDGFLSLVRPILSEVDRALSAADQAEVIRIVPGDRRIKTVLRG